MIYERADFVLEEWQRGLASKRIDALLELKINVRRYGETLRRHVAASADVDNGIENATSDTLKFIAAQDTAEPTRIESLRAQAQLAVSLLREACDAAGPSDGARALGS